MDQYGNYQANLGNPPYPVPTTAITQLVAGNPTSLGTTGSADSFAFDTVGLNTYYTAIGTTWTLISGGGGSGYQQITGGTADPVSAPANPAVVNLYVNTTSGVIWTWPAGGSAWQ